jgi:putative copper export protein
MFSLLVQGGKLADADLVAPWSPEVGQVLFTTRYGAIWLFRIVLGLCLVGVVRGGGRRQHIVGAALAGAMLVTLTLVSHAASDSPPTFPLLFDILHLAAASTWVGGLLHFAATLATLRPVPAPQKTLMTANLIPRFSDVALVSVSTLVASGVVASLSRVGSWEGLFGTLYGRTLLFKLSVAAPMLLLGANNLLRVTPRMREAARHGGDASLVERFRGYVTTESWAWRSS